MKRSATSEQNLHDLAERLEGRLGSPSYILVETSTLSRTTVLRLARNGGAPAIVIYTNSGEILAIIDSIDGDRLCRDQIEEGNDVSKLIEKFPKVERWVIDIANGSMSIEKYNNRMNPKVYTGSVRVHSRALRTRVSVGVLLGLRKYSAGDKTDKPEDSLKD